MNVRQWKPDVGRYTHRAGRRAWLALIVPLLALTFTARAEQTATVIESDETSYKLGHHAMLLVDEGGELTIDDVSSGPASRGFEPLDDPAPSLGFSTATAWVRFSVDNVLDEDQLWLLESAYPHVDYLELYIPNGDGGFDVRVSGDMIPFGQREVPYRNPVFRIKQPPGVTTYYLKAHTSGSLTLPLTAWLPDAFTAHVNAEQPALWMFYGVLLALSLYNFLIFFSVRTTAYLFYVLSSLSYALCQFVLNGLAFQYLWPNSVWWANQILPSAIALGWAAGTLFFRRFVEPGKQLPRADKYLKVLGLYVQGAAVIVCMFLPYAIGIRVVVVSGVGLIPVALYSCAVMVKRRHRPAIYYTVAWSLLLLGILLYLLKTMNVLPSNFLTEWVIQIGGSLEMILLSLGLADRINVMRKDLQVLNGKLRENVSELEVALDNAEEARRAKSEFLASVSHELRTPLNTIINVPQGLLEDFEELSTIQCRHCGAQFEREPDDVIDASTSCPECGEIGQLCEATQHAFKGDPGRSAMYLDQVVRSGSHLLEVINDILDISRLEAGRENMESGSVDMSRLFEDRIMPMAGLADRQGVVLKVLPCPVPCVVHGDGVKLAQVFINLVGNAIKFSDGQGMVTVQTTRDGDDFVFAVSDQGIGISEADQARIFESFVQAEGGQTRRFGGSGLGLAITKKLVDMHGGSIAVESKVGAGSTFTVRLPADDPEQPELGDAGRQVSPSQQPPTGDVS